MSARSVVRMTDETLEVTVSWGQATAGEVVKLAGEFNSWQPEPMEKVEGGWSKCLKLSSGRYMFKFVVGDQWMVNSDLPTVMDDSGNTNNVLEVAESEGSGGDSDSWEKVSIPDEPALALSCNLQKISLVERLYCFQGSYEEAVAGIQSLGAELQEDRVHTETYHDTADLKLQRGGVWLKSEDSQWEMSRLTASNVISSRDQLEVTNLLREHLGSPQSSDLAVMVSENLQKTLEVSVRCSSWLVGHTSVEVVQTVPGLVTVRLKEAGDLVAATNSLQSKADTCNLTLYNARLAAVLS